MSKYYETDTFAALSKEWADKLSKDGFVDIESDENRNNSIDVAIQKDRKVKSFARNKRLNLPVEQSFASFTAEFYRKASIVLLYWPYNKHKGLHGVYYKMLEHLINAPSVKSKFLSQDYHEIGVKGSNRTLLRRLEALEKWINLFKFDSVPEWGAVRPEEEVDWSYTETISDPVKHLIIRDGIPELRY